MSLVAESPCLYPRLPTEVTAKGLLQPLQECGDKAQCGASMSALKDGPGGVSGGTQVRSGTDSDGGPTRAFKQYATKFSGPGGGTLGASAKQESDANDRRHSQSTDKDTNQDDSLSLSFESSFFEKSENSESQFSSEKSSEVRAAAAAGCALAYIGFLQLCVPQQLYSVALLRVYSSLLIRRYAYPYRTKMLARK